MGATGQGAVVLRKVLEEAPNWVELEETEEAHDGGLARSAPLKLPSLTGRGRCQASAGRPDWNLTWRTGRFAPSEYANCNGSCRVNHIPKSSAICKKDNLVRHVRKARGVFGQIYNFLPTSFLVPTEYTKFAEHFSDLAERGEKSTWICKPTGMSRGRKIFLLDDISGLAYDRACVVQRYIPRPMLIGGYKMDIRLYVVVTSARPLRAFIYQEGLARFSTEKYDMSDLSNVFSHLTNHSVNKNSVNYETEKDVIGGGAKWLFSRLLRYLEDHGHDIKLLWTRIRHICILTVLILMPLAPAEAAGCFELFGFDILVDDQLHPWLLEVNAAPALAAGSDVDWAVKEPLLRDLIGLLDFNNPGTHDALDSRKPKRQRQATGGSRGGRRGSSSAGGSGSHRPNSRKQLPDGAGRSARPPSRPDSADRLSEVSDSAREQRSRSPLTAGRDRFGGYEQIFPFNDRMADLSEHCSEGLGGKVIAEHGKVVRHIVEEVRRMEEGAAMEAAGGAIAGKSDFRASGGASGNARRLLSRDIDTDPSLPGRKDHQGAKHRRTAAMAGGLDAGSRGGVDSLPPSSGTGSGRFDLAASLADTDAAIASLTAPSIA
jgi:tubulin polyglutamylase TTLL2